MPTCSALAVDVDLDLALADDRLLVLADLIALRQVRIEVVLAVEDRAQVDLGLEAEPGAHRLRDAFGIDDGQHAGHRRIDERDVLLGSAPNAVEAPENSFDLEATWACTSSPTMTSQSPVAPAMRFLGAALTLSCMGFSCPALVIAGRR